MHNSLAMQKRLLLVDDEVATLIAYRKLLSSPSVQLDTAATMEEATLFLQNSRYHVVISDLRLSGTFNLDGFEIVRLAKAKNPQTQIIVITAYGTPEVLDRAFDLGVARYFEKPVIAEDLKKAIKSLGVEI